MPRYRNLEETPHHRDLGGVLKWKLGLGPEPARRTPARAAVPAVANDGAALRGAPRPALTWVGHATYLVQLAGRSILTDPVLSPRLVTIARNVPPGLDWPALPRIDAVTVSHNHMDHMDAPTLKRLGPDVTYVVAQGLGPWFKRAGLTRVVELGWWEQAEVAGVGFTFVPSHHWSRRGLFDENATLWGGFVMEAEGLRVYHSGDTAYFAGFKEIGARVGAIDAAMLPIGAYEPRWFMKSQHMNPVDAVDAFTDLAARRFFAMHWGTFKLTDEALEEPPAVLRATWEQRGLPDARLCVPAIGETIYL